MKNSTSAATVAVWPRTGSPQAGSCAPGASAGRDRRWLLVGAVALPVVAVLLASARLGFATVLPFLYLLPCLLMSAMCMKGMAGKKPDEAH